jgi:hypothetical protein
VIARHAGNEDTVLLEELGVARGFARIDLALVNGAIHGFEIKSDRDTLRRLRGQAELFSRVLDRATLVATERHLDEAQGILPAWWGIQRVEATAGGALAFRAIRRGRENPAPDPRTLVEFLWLDDALALLEENNAARGVRGKPRPYLWDRICEALEPEAIARAVRTQLKARAGQQVHP